MAGTINAMVGSPLMLANGLDDLVAVQLRHVNVQEQQIEGFLCACNAASPPSLASRTVWPRRTSSCSRSCELNSLSSARDGNGKDRSEVMEEEGG